jgi:RNA polymerase sigma-70 factor (ECF subfamily)
MVQNIQEIIDNVLKGDWEGYAEIVKRHQDGIWRIVAYAMQDVSTTEEIVQEIFVKVYSKLETYDPERDFSVWLRTIARNHLRNEIRRKMREKKALKSYREYLVKRLYDNDTSEKHESSLLTALRKCREGLSDDAREALNLRYEQSLGFEEIGNSLNRTLAAARQMLTRVRRSLRRCIEERMAQS